MSILVELAVTDAYTFEIRREAQNRWYANALPNDGTGFFIHKWTTGRTKKPVMASIKGFTD